MQDRALTRRDFSLYALSSPLACALGHPSARKTLRTITLDWGIAETLLALGHIPLGVGEVGRYNHFVMTPRMPERVIDVGLRFEPNVELIQSLEPDLILINPIEQRLRSLLRSVSNIVIIPLYTNAGQPYRLACTAVKTLACLLGDPAASDALLARADKIIASTRDRLKTYDARPLYLVEVIDKYRVAVADGNSLFQNVLDQLGLRNAWTGKSNVWGTTIVGIEALAAEPDARILYFAANNNVQKTMTTSFFWTRLPCVRAQRAIAFPQVWLFGALPSAMRIVRLLGDVLTSPQATND